MYPQEEIVLPVLKSDDLDDVPPAGRALAESRSADFELVRSEGQYRKAVQAYLASITYADALIGRLLDALDSGPHASDTVIVLWSDHGWHLGEKGHWHKQTLWERSTRVPLAIAAPGVTRAGSRSDAPVNLVDLYPTLVELCGLEERPKLDGQNLVPLLADPSKGRNRAAITTSDERSHAVRTSRYRYIRYADGGQELYDHDHDPHEWTNLAGRAEYEPLIRELRAHLPENDAAPVPDGSAYDFDPLDYSWTPREARAAAP
jgi:arylsulfatase A-like enzyme